MREDLVCRRYIKLENGTQYEISYFILAENYTGDAAIERLGVKIDMRETDVPENKKSAVVRDITVNQNRINEIINLLSRNLVTPIGLRDVIDDCI